MRGRCEAGGTDWSDASINQGMPRIALITRNQKQQEVIAPRALDREGGKEGERERECV